MERIISIGRPDNGFEAAESCVVHAQSRPARQQRSAISVDSQRGQELWVGNVMSARGATAPITAISLGTVKIPSATGTAFIRAHSSGSPPWVP